ncbi:MAG: PASTA domain-containing protein [Microthrixaceae bacterium]
MKRLSLVAIVVALVSLGMSGWALQRSYDADSDRLPRASVTSTSTTGSSSTTTLAANLVLVPTLLGKDGLGASVILRNLGLEAKVVTAPSVTVGKNRVIAVEPAVGTKVPKGTVVQLTLSSGPP